MEELGKDWLKGGEVGGNYLAWPLSWFFRPTIGIPTTSAPFRVFAMSGCAPHKQCINTCVVLTCSVLVCQHGPLVSPGWLSDVLADVHGSGPHRHGGGADDEAEEGEPQGVGAPAN
jgi:hypothetical protein